MSVAFPAFPQSAPPSSPMPTLTCLRQRLSTPSPPPATLVPETSTRSSSTTAAAPTIETPSRTSAFFKWQAELSHKDPMRHHRPTRPSPLSTLPICDAPNQQHDPREGARTPPRHDRATVIQGGDTATHRPPTHHLAAIDGTKKWQRRLGGDEHHGQTRHRALLLGVVQADEVDRQALSPLLPSPSPPLCVSRLDQGLGTLLSVLK
ncbi:hypothetical protein GALMADRAFT_144238 [Galerina marginata CBS 339.88]|uniref:Uncharacterized protein n=1 Tax=Galerina marginata (strain CBS 339.88) TaxID=685588 RepID=A0A067SMB0_GALM3|nr:hypothetical protein GALMADRAFT_144238 [Galerina marginata CBS 339.88]